MKVLAVIPARCNSMRIRHKNVAKIGRWPMIRWTLDASLSSCLIDRVIINTDCQRILDMQGDTKALHVTVPGHDFERGEASDAVVSVLEHRAELIEFEPDLVVMLLPTSPFRSGQDIDVAIQSYIADDADTLISVSPIPVEQRKLRWVEDFMRVKRLRPLTAEHICESNGAIQIARPAHLLKYKSFHAGDVMPYFMDGETGMDIDTPEDLERARKIAEKYSHVRT